MNLQEARKQLPELAGLDDQSAFDVIHQAYYPTWDKAYLAQQLGYTPPVPEPRQAGVARTLGDVGIKLAQGAVDLGSSVVGLGSLATGGLLGQGMRAIGYDPHATNAMLGEYLSDSQKAADAKVQQANGFVDSVAAAVNNPRAILGSVAESAPGMLAGMGVTNAVARGIAAKAALATAEGAAASATELAAGKTAAQATKAALATEAGGSAASNAVEAAGKRLLAIGAATEGAQSAGQIADDAQAAGRAYSDYALPAAAAGAITGGIGYGAGRWMGDAATELATGARSTGVKGSLPMRLAKEAFSEGVLEEMPQSAQEQYFTNIAQGEADRMQGVGNAAGTGMLVGGVIGAGMGAMQGHHGHALPNSGPLTQAVNAANSAANSATLPANTIPYEATPVPRPAPAAATPELNLVSYPEGGIDFDPQPDARGAHQRAPIVPVSEAGQNTPAVPNYDGGIEYMPPPQQVSDDNILNFSERNAPIHLRHAQALVAAGKERNLNLQVVPHAGGDGFIVVPTLWLSARDRQQYAPLQQRGVLSAPSGSFANMNELADLAQAERADIDHQRAALLAQQQAQVKARQDDEHAQLAALMADEEAQKQQQANRDAEAAMPVTNAIVAHDMAQRAQNNRAALRNQVLNDAAIPPAQKKAAFLAALQQDGYAKPQLTEEDHREIDIATVPVKSAPNELVDAVPERQESAAATKARHGNSPNFAAVDAAIAAGMRLRTSHGAVLHKKGSSKIFRLNQAQKAYYLQQMLALPEQAHPALAIEPAPAMEAAPQVATPNEVDEHQERLALNRLTVKDMSDSQLLRASHLFAVSPRAPKINKELAKRGLLPHNKAIVPASNPDGKADIITADAASAAPAQHIEGHTIEVATPAVIAQSIAKSAANTPLNLKQAKAELLAEIDAAIANAVDETVIAQQKAELLAAQEQYNHAFKSGKAGEPDPAVLKAAQRRLDEARRAFSMVVFDVRGDGKFTVRNAAENLLAFRARVMSSPGFSETGKGSKVPVPKALHKSAEASVIQMLETGKWIDAFHLARRIGKPFGFVVNTNQGDLPGMYVDTRPLEIAAGLPGFVGRHLSAPGTPDSYFNGPWHVVDTNKGKRLSAEGKTMEEVVEKVKNAFANATPAEIAEFGADLPDVSQASLQAAWLEGVAQFIAASENKTPAPLSESAPTANEATTAAATANEATTAAPTANEATTAAPTANEATTAAATANEAVTIEATANPAPTHSEGSTIEAATPAVIAQSIAKSAANTPMNLKQAKADLLAQIDAAMAHVADERVVQAQKAELEAADELVNQLLKSKNADKVQLAVAERRLGAARRAFQMVTFDVPGDGKFTVRNTKENLLAFRARVQSSPGFSGRSTALKAPIPAGLRNSAEASIADMLVDNEWVAAFNLAQRIGKPFRFGANHQGGAPILYVDTQVVDVGHGLSTFAGRQVPVLSKAGSYRSGRWYVMETTKALSIGEGGDTLAEAMTAAKSKLSGITPEKLAQTMAKIPDAPQSTLEAAWLAHAEEHDAWAARLRHNLPLKPAPAQSGRGASEDATHGATPVSKDKHAPASSAATPAPADAKVAAAGPVAAPTANTESTAPPAVSDSASSTASAAPIHPAETAPQPNNKRHTVKKSTVLTPAGAIKASATGHADTQIWYHQGNVSQLEFNAKATVNGQPPPESAKRRWAEIQHARANGWKLANYRAGSLGTVWVLEKKDEFLTRAGAQTDGADLFARPDTPEPETGWASIQARHWAYTAALAKWLATLPESTLNSLPALSAKFNATGIAKWARIIDDNPGKLIRFYDAAGNMDVQFFAREVSDYALRQGMRVPPDLDTLLHQIAAQVETGRKGSATHDEHNQRVVARLRAGETGAEAIKRVVAAPAENAITHDAPVAGVVQDVPQPATEPVTASATSEPQAEQTMASATGESQEEEANKAQGGSDAPAAVAQSTGNATEEPASTPVDEASPAESAANATTDETNQAAQSGMPLASLAAFEQVFDRASHGQLSVDEFHAAFASFNQNEAAILAELSRLKKDDLLRYGGAAFTYQHRADRKESVVHALIDTLREQFAFAKDSTLSYSLTSNHTTWPAARRHAINEAVASTTQDDLERYAAKAQEQRDQRKAKLAGLNHPRTLDDFIALTRAKMREGSTFREARLSLSPQQRALFDQLAAEKSWAERGANKTGEQALQPPNATVGTTDIIQTKHTKHGHDLWQFNLDQRVSPDQFKALVVQARRLGGDYSSYRGRGAIPGWQFRSEDAAKAFKQLVAGETGAAEQVMQARRDAFADDKSQSAVERLREMADAMEAQANDSLSRERKVNTSRRAEMADRAESTARAAVAFAATMRHIAQAIESGTTRFLVHVRQKTQIALLNSLISRAWYDQRVASGLRYGEIEQQKGMPADQETADHAEWPAYSAYRSDLAKLGRQLLEVDGTKQLGRDILKVADDVTDEYLAFAKKNLGAVMKFHAKDGGLLGFPSKTAVEDAIARSGYRGRAIPYAIKRNEWTVILSPTEAMTQGVWQGDGDKRIHLTDTFGRTLVEKIGRVNHRGARVSVPWQFETAHQRQATLARMNIQSPAELRAALREFIALQQSPPEPDKIKLLERRMVGRTQDGLDFFPTGPAAADEMIDVAAIEPGMRVLEPSAGWGHIAEKIRDAGVEPDVIELSGDRRELLEAKGFHLVGQDFMAMQPSANPSDGYDRILMNPPFSNRRDADHVQHAYTLLAPAGRLVAIMGEGVFFGQDKKAQAFRGWLDAVGGTSEKLPEGSFMDASLPVNTSVNARMVVINAPSGAIASNQVQGRTETHANEVETTDTTAPIDEARLIDVGLLNQTPNGYWQYKDFMDGNWRTANDKESAMHYAALAYQETPEDQRLTQAQRGELADAQEHAHSEQRYGPMTMEQLRARYAEMTAEIGQLQTAGRREFNANGGRRTAAAVSNEAARELGAEKMRLARFIAFREAQASVPNRPLSAEQEADLKDKVKRLADIDAKMDRANANAVGDGNYQHKSRARATTGHARASANAQYRDTVATHLRLTVRELLATGYHVPDKYIDPIRSVLDYNAQGNYEPIADSAKPKLSQSAPAVAGHSAPSLAAAMASALRQYGDDFFQNLTDTGAVQIITSEAAGTLLGSAQASDDVPIAFYHPENGVTYLIADAISQQLEDKALHGLMLHELANHALQMGRSTPEFKQLLNYFSLMQGGNKAVAAAFARARQVGTDPAHLNEEALGYYLEANPTLSFAQKVVAWFRAAIRKLGMALTPLMHRARWFRAVALMSPEDLIYAAQKVLKGAPQALAQQGKTAQHTTTPAAAQVAFSKAQQEGLLVSTWNKIAGAKDVYQYPVSNSRDLTTVLQTVMPNIKIDPLPVDDAKARSKASAQWRVTLPDGKQAFIFEFGRDLQIDASRLVSGSSRGSALYAAVANYAYNTGKVLEGDSAGFSEVAQMRRLEAMISTALKFGSTDHIRPHPLQRNPRGPLAARLGMKGFSWATGDFDHNVAQMMQASYDYIHSLVPEIANVHVTEFSDFTGGDGDLFTDDSFRQLAERATRVLHQRMAASGINTTAQVGSATLKRAAITGTVLRGEGSAAGRALLGLIGTELHANIGQAENILYSRGLGQALSDAANNISQVQLPAGYVVGDLFNQSGKLSWWHKTIGTMDNLAKRHPQFAQVYEAVQSFLGDVSRYAVVAADKAPTLLPKLENISDILGAKRKKPLTAQDTKAISAPIFEGTLIWARDENGNPVKLEAMEKRAKLMSVEEKSMILLQHNVIDVAQNRVWQRQTPDSYTKLINSKYEESQLKAGVVWQDQELRDLFGLSDAQIGLYREFRAAIDMSLTNLTISEMVKLGGKEAKPLLEVAMATGNLQNAADLLTRHFMDLAQLNQDQQDSHLDTAQQIANLAGRGLDLMQRGYAPLTRFGRFTVYVQQNGEQRYFGMFESQVEAGKMARRMRKEFPDAEVLHGTLSDESYKLFAGISPETVELFGSMVGLDSQADAASTQVYQTYLKLAKSNRSALKRLIERKGIAGFSEDAGRVLAGFIYSNARLTSGNAHLGEIDEAVAAIPKQQGQLVDAAMQLREHIRNPEGNSAMLGGLMFAQFLGGSVASAMVNLTQPLTMTLPYLSQFGGIAKAGQRLLAAVRDAGKAQTGDAKLDAALKWAADEGIVAPQEVHYLQAQAAGKGVLQSGDGTRIGDARATWNNVRSKLMLGWGKLFAMAELTNRRVTFIAAWHTAMEQGMANPAQFAQEAVAQTQGVYNSGNKPRWARGTLGGLALTFKQYSIAYVELLARMAFAGKPGSPERAAGQRAALYMLAVLFLMSGADGLPFEKNLEDAIDGILQRLGYNFSSKRQKQAFLTDVLGEGGADFVLKGVSSLPGMPIDVASRFGMGNLIPATGLLTKKESYTSDLGELAGPAGDVAKRAFQATGKALGGDVLDAALDIAPQSVRNVAKGIDMLATGEYKDTRGYKVNDVTSVEAAMKMVGFQPESTAKIQDAKGQALNMLAQARMRSNEIQEHLAQGIVSGDVEMQREARAWRDDWNAKNPETPVSINMPGVVKRVRAMRQDVIARTQMTAPKALKQSVRNELQQGRN